MINIDPGLIKSSIERDILLDEAQLSRYSEFFAIYASYMLGCGATCIRIDKNLRRMANAAGFKIDMIILSHHVTVVCTDNSTGLYCQHTRHIAPIGVSFEINTRLSELSWKFAERKISFEDTQKLFYRIVNHKSISNSKILILVVIANAAFCHLFGGDWGAMFIVGVATFIGFSVKTWTESRHWDSKIVWLICSFISALCAAGMTYIPHLTQTPDWGIAASVLYLIPGIPYINSVSDGIDGHYLSSIGRLIHAVALTVCIAIGLTAGLLLADIRPMVG